MRRHVAMLSALSIVLAGGAATVSARADDGQSHSHHKNWAYPGLDGIPTGAPDAAYRAEPVLPTPQDWPFPDAFPRTSGTGRLDDGATYWSDFVYDDHGANGVEVQQPIASLAPTGGTYVYSDPNAKNNGADIFRAAIGLDDDASYWRIDWNTLVDKNVPIGEWTIDGDNDTRTGGSAWPAGAGVGSPGIDKALVVTAKSTQIIDVVSGKTLATEPTTVDMDARSFVVRIPLSVLDVSGTSKVRLAAGVADSTDQSFAPVSQSDGALPGQPAVYNVTFRSYQQEPPVYKPTGDQGELEGNGLARGSKYGNFWMERHQSDALTNSGDVSAFSLNVNWAQLADKRYTPELQPTGYTNRWYVSQLDLGQGVIPNPSNSGTGDLRPNFLGRVQPYAVYVPTTFDKHQRTPLTWILHSLSVQHNQYGALDPSMIQQECEDRHSICATTLGYGPDGWYNDEAESDFWQVWHQLALTYPLDPERTVISGYSMGGFASYKLGLEYPDLFAKAMPLAGPPECGLFLAEGAGGDAGGGRCTTAGDTTPMIVNARWLPYILGDGVEDELVPVTSVLQQVDTFLNDGNRIHFELYPAEDHLVFATQDGFSNEIAQLGTTTRAVDPGHITYSWYPVLNDPKLGLGPTGDYWVRGITGRDSSTMATLDVQSSALDNPVITPSQSEGANAQGDPTPNLILDQTWSLANGPARADSLLMTLTNVASIGVDMARAQLASGGTIKVTTDGVTSLTLLNLQPGLTVTGGVAPATVGDDGSVTVQVPSGTHTLTVG